jgi:uncharacterized protein (TIGR03492 family)
VSRLLVITNGIGEDSVGAEIIRRLPAGITAEAYPTLGDGRAYDGVCTLVGPRASLASEGSRVGGGSILRDIRGGLLGTILPALKFLRSAKAAYDQVLVIGDFIGIAACWLAGIRGVVYVDVYRSGYGSPYSVPEKWVIARTTRLVFTRHPDLAAALAKAGAKARAVGNVMMDTVPSGDYAADQRRLRLKAVTLLPGSRDGAIVNFVLQVEALAALTDDLRPDIFVVVADGIEPKQLAEAAEMFFHEPTGRETADLGRLSGRGLRINMVRGALEEVLAETDLVLSQAGTATIQALGLGKPVITVVPETARVKRIEELQRFFGESRETVPANAAVLAAAMTKLLDDRKELARRGAIGAERIGPPGAIREIIAALQPEAVVVPIDTVVAKTGAD